MGKLSLWTPMERRLLSTAEEDGFYENPYWDVEVKVVMTSPTGKVLEGEAFWDGGREWVLRFAPCEAGVWEWRTVCSNPGDRGLHNRAGRFAVFEERGTKRNALQRHGFLCVGENGRGFAFDDGTPFFWLGDTAWAATAHARLEEWREYARHRAAQGFNVLQLNALPQFDASRHEHRVPFEPGRQRFERLRPDYFQMMDRLAAEAWRSGAVCAIVVCWFNYVPGTRPEIAGERGGFDEESAWRFGRYLAARYGAYGAVWIVSGDTDYEHAGAIAVYDAAARGVEAGSFYPALKTAHLHGGMATPAALNERGWLDFHMHQSCHVLKSGEAALRYAKLNRGHRPVRPVLNGEPCYDAIRLFDDAEGRVADRTTVRRVLWTSVLGGGNAGITYGVHGVWPWHREEAAFEAASACGMPLPWREAMKRESSNDAAVLKRVMEQIRWWLLETVEEDAWLYPGNDSVDCVVAVEREEGKAAAVIAYFAERTEAGWGVGIEAGMYVWMWINPVTEAGQPAVVNARERRISAASWEGDAVLLGTLSPSLSLRHEPAAGYAKRKIESTDAT